MILTVNDSHRVPDNSGFVLNLAREAFFGKRVA